MTTFDLQISPTLRTPQVIVALIALRGLLANRKMAIEVVLATDARALLAFDPVRGHELDQIESEICGLDATLQRYESEHPDAWQIALQIVAGGEGVALDALDGVPFCPRAFATVLPFGGGE